MKVGIIGSGIVGRVLGTAFLKEGHQVMLGSRDPLKKEVVQWKQENSNGLAGNFAETAQFGEMIVLAVPGNIVMDAIQLADKETFANKTVIDATNPISAGAPEKGVLKYFSDINSSLMENIQEHLPAAKLVKAFNSVGSALMYKPDFKGTIPTMFICGNDPGAKLTVTDILHSFGWETEDMGAANAARAIEPLAMLWCIPGFLKNDWTHAFKLLKQ